MEVLGWAGTALVVIAYYPQIHHLFVESARGGISVLTWLIWLVASLLGGELAVHHGEHALRGG
jgi:uncharacterized protein with PQ loop repeat